MRKCLQLLVASSVLLSASAAFAQPSTPRVDDRQAQQQQRIQQGVASGELTRTEARALQAEQAHIRRVEARAKADGVVTKAERRHLAHLQNQASRHIARQKHDRQRRH